MESQREEALPAPEESPRPTAFTIDFGDDKKVDLARHKSLTEKFQQRHRRGKSLSKLETPIQLQSSRKKPVSGCFPRKSSFQAEDDKPERCKSANPALPKRSDLHLPLENKCSDRMAQSFPNDCSLFGNSPMCELQNLSSPDLDLISPFSPNVDDITRNVSSIDLSSEGVSRVEQELDGKSSDTVSECGTYTLDVDNYSEEQKARMSIDNEFKIEKLSVQEKTVEYLNSLAGNRYLSDEVPNGLPPVPPLKPHQLPLLKSNELLTKKPLSPIISPTESKKSDEGTVISVTSSGVFRNKSDDEKKLQKKLSLTKSEVHVEAYIDGKIYSEQALSSNPAKSSGTKKSKLTANIVNVQSIEVNPSSECGAVVSASFSFGKAGNVATVTTGLPPTSSPTKIPSPIHTLSRPRSRNSLHSALLDDFDTDSILKPTRNFINTLQHKLSLDSSDAESDFETRFALNNTAHLLKQRPHQHIRHNSLDDRINNKLEHFQNKNLQPIDQTFTNNVFNQCKKINNSPSNSPIRRSSSFTNKNQINNVVKASMRKESNLCISPMLTKHDNIQRSSSTACIKPSYNYKSSEHKKIDRNRFGDTETSSEEDLEANHQKKKDLGNLSNTRCNRTFSLRRARVDNEIKCPNTPDMRRKNLQVGLKQERAISMDRKPMKTNEVQSRYLSNVTKRPVSATKPTTQKPASAQFARTDTGRFSMRASKTAPPVKGMAKKPEAKQNGGARSNSSLSCREVEFQNWKRRKSYDPMKAAAEGKKKEMEKRMMSKSGGTNASPDSSPSHSGSVHRSQSFHGTAALEQLISSDEDDLTFSADEGFSPPTPSPCELSPTKANLRHSFWDRIRN
ncbi:hypothetical protein ABEB36_000979 [Hypothenemus hampei]|uniref:Uncharacterized protein n=1 Tax=Hypothenemus hampei TaxID=57062 RepID=A0ABD1FGC7_HYPHA